MSSDARARWLARMFGADRASRHPRSPHPTLPARERATPVTRDRIAAYLLSRGYRFLIDDDGDLTGTWDGSRFWFLLLGDNREILQVRGRWQRTLPTARRTAVLLAANDWNRERIWPKVYVREEDGELALYSEVSVDLEPGVTASQLAQLIACGLGTGVQMFTVLDTLLPPGTTLD
jgi:hypothetical protein